MAKIVTFGEIMLRLATPGYQRFAQATEFEATYGGGEANVAVSLANFGMSAKFVTRLPNNDLGMACSMNLKKFSVETQDINYGGDRIGIYYLETGAVNRPSKVIYDRAYSSFSEVAPEMFDWDTIFEGAEWFHWTGITPAVSESAAITCLAACKAAKAKGLKISCDLNYRAKLWKWGKKAHEVMPELVSYCDVILGNEEDAEKVFGIKAPHTDVDKGIVDAKAFQVVCQEMMAKFPQAKKIIITLRGSVNANHNTWMGVLYDGKTLYQSATYNITHIVDRVGGGDSFMGGLIYGLLSYPSDQQALDFAVAASCLKHTISGDFNMVTVPEVEALMKGDGSGRVQR
jgi:2-dehydro-3-deoxygluconokinase